MPYTFHTRLAMMDSRKQVMTISKHWFRSEKGLALWFMLATQLRG